MAKSSASRSRICPGRTSRRVLTSPYGAMTTTDHSPRSDPHIQQHLQFRSCPRLRASTLGVFRCDNRGLMMDIFAGFSDDGINWNINHDPIVFEPAPGCDPCVTRKEYRYDPRVCFIEDRYYITWCNGFHGPTIGVGYTYDFKTFYQLENAYLPYNRNGVLFPRKIGDNFAMLSRPSDTGHPCSAISSTARART